MQTEPSGPHRSPLIPRLLVGLVLGVTRCPRLVLAGSLLLCALALAYSTFCLEYRTQRTDLVSPDKDYKKRWQNYLAEFGDDDDIVVVVRGQDRKRMRDALDRVAQEIRAYPCCFDRIFYQMDLRPFRSRALLYLPTNDIVAIRQNLRTMGLLLELGPLSWRTLGLTSLLGEAEARGQRLRPEVSLEPRDEQFLTQLVAVVRAATSSLADPSGYYNPWKSLLVDEPEQEDMMAEPQYFFSTDGTLAILLVRPIKEAGSFTACSQSVDTIRSIVANMRKDFNDLEFGLTGLPVLENDEMTASQNDTQLASILALVGVALLYYLVYRHWHAPFLTVATLIVGTLWALGWLTLTVGHLNILSSTFAIMLIGMGDYGVLWVTRFDLERAECDDVSEALVRTAEQIGPSILTAAVTTALAFFAAMLADFQAVAELGWIAGSGILLCALACFTVLPALICLTARFSQKKAEKEPDATVLPFTPAPPAWLPTLGKHPRWVIAAGVVLVLYFGAHACRIGYDHNLLNMQASDLESVKWERTLMDRMTGTSWHALSYTGSREEALALKARYERLPGVSRVVEVASMIPGDQEAKLPVLEEIQHRLRKLPERGQPIAHSVPNLAVLRQEVAELVEMYRPLASEDWVLADLFGALVELNQRLTALPAGPASAEAARRFDERLAGDLAEDLYRLREVAHPEAITVADLPPTFRERFVGKSGKWLLRAFAAKSLWDFEPLKDFCRQVQTIDPDATGKPFATLEGLRGMRNGFLWAGAYALLAIVIVLALDFRRPVLVLGALAPLAAGMICALGIMQLLGLALNPANMIALPLILGVGVDNGVHVLHDFLSRRRDRRYCLSHAIGRSILVASLTTILGFGTLMISTHRGLSSLGLILTLGVTCCMLAALVFLPAVLRLLDRPIANAPQQTLGLEPAKKLAA